MGERAKNEKSKNQSLHLGGEKVKSRPVQGANKELTSW
jgi:hypothetical protein